MSIKYLPFLFLLVSLKYSFSQAGTWVWLKGGDSTRAQPIYGVQGVPDMQNQPGGLSFASNWMDTSGNFWIFGGAYTVLSGNSISGKSLNDLWKYDPRTNIWTWMKGAGQPGARPVYGIMGVSSPLNTPGANGQPNATWTDINNNLWMYGGVGFGNSVLWKYSIVQNEWTWVNGDTTNTSLDPIYGNFQQPSILNSPGVRTGSTTWLDKNNNLYLFGGHGNWRTVTNNSLYSDMWKYDITRNEWAWVGGPQGPGNIGNYGRIAIEDKLNLPPTRVGCSGWKDENDDFFVYGGYNYCNPNNALFNDVWKYNPSRNMWTWVAGDSSANSKGSYSEYCNPIDGSEPAARAYSSSSQSSCQSLAYVFGGTRDTSYRQGPFSNGYLFVHAQTFQNGGNDLWAFDTRTYQWNWLSGQNGLNSLGKYGICNQSSSSNQISARYAECTWLDNEGTLWVFGGVGFDTVHTVLGGRTPCCEIQTKNDLWKFVPDTSCVHITPCNSSSTSVDIFIPNAFTPNGDGVNDRLTIFGKNITQYEIKIFNRAGQLMYLSDDATEVNDTTRGWDGTCKGHLQETGVYVYYITGKNISGTPFDKKGSVTLIR